MNIRDAIEADIDEIIAVHVSAFPKAYMTSLGPRFLKFFYGGILAYDKGICLVATDEVGEIVGFAAGFADSVDFYRRLNASKYKTIAAILPTILKNPGLLLGVAARYFSRTAGGTIEDGAMELASLAVSVRRQGQGTGGLLAEAFRLRASAVQGCHHILLTTNADSNDVVNAFYKKNEYSLVRTEFQHGRLMNVYQKRI